MSARVPAKVRDAVLANARRNRRKVAEIVEGEYRPNGDGTVDPAYRIWFGVDHHGEQVTAGIVE